MSYELQYEIFKLIGWATVILVVLSSSLLVLIFCMKYLSTLQASKPWILHVKTMLKKMIMLLREYHTAIGTMVLMMGIIHGYWLTGSFQLHSGYILWAVLILTAITGILKMVFRTSTTYPMLRKLHTASMIIAVLLMVFHVLTMKGILQI